METRLPLQDRVIGSIREAERLSTELERLKALEVGMVDFGLLQAVLFKWDAAVCKFGNSLDGIRITR